MQSLPSASPCADSDGDRLFARMPTVRRLTGLGRSTIYRLMANREFPAQVRIGVRAVRVVVATIYSLSAARRRADDVVHCVDSGRPTR
jgi:prophage regulatory protein